MNSISPATAPAPPSSPLVRLRSDLDFRVTTVGDHRRFVCHDTLRGKYFHFGGAEYEIAKSLDGSQTIEQIAEHLDTLNTGWTKEDVSQLVFSLVQAGLAEVVATDGTGNEPAPSSAVQASEGIFWAKSLSFLISQRIPLLSANRPAVWLTRRFHRIFSPLGVALWCLLVLSAAWLALVQRAAFTSELQHLFSPDAWLWMILIWVLAKVVHESGHAVAARRQGVTIGNAGIMFFLFAPLAYVDVTDAWRLPKKWARMQIALAGVYIELAIASIALWTWFASNDVMVRHLAAQVAVLMGPATLLVNANPLLRLDGYFVLSDWLAIPNLRMHGRRQLAGWCERCLLGKPLPASLLHGWRRWAATLHAACSVLFQIVWMSGLVWGVTFWIGGLGFLVGGAAVTVWLLMPLQRWVGGLLRDEHWPQYRPRLAICAFLSLTAIVGLAWLPSPLGRRIPIVIRYQDEQIARAASDGFVTEVCVQSLATVERGTILLRMEDPELQTRLAECRLDLKMSEIRRRQLHQQGKSALANAELDQQAAFTTQIRELERQVAALTVCAEAPGTVTTANVQRLLGRYVRQGDVLLRIGEPQRKEVLASIDGPDLLSYQAAVRKGDPLSIRIRGSGHFRIMPADASPRAGDTIPHPALAADAGGPLALVPPDPTDPDARPRLAESRTESISPLAPEVALQLRAGQQGMMILGDQRSLAERAWESFQKRR